MDSNAKATYPITFDYHNLITLNNYYGPNQLSDGGFNHAMRYGEVKINFSYRINELHEWLYLVLIGALTNQSDNYQAHLTAQAIQHGTQICSRLIDLAHEPELPFLKRIIELYDELTPVNLIVSHKP